MREYGAGGPLDVRLLLDQQRLSVGWGENWEVLTLLNEMPTEGTVNQLTTRLEEVMDSSRTMMVMERLLSRIESERSRFVIIDVTGVLAIDTQVSHHNYPNDPRSTAAIPDPRVSAYP